MEETTNTATKRKRKGTSTDSVVIKVKRLSERAVLPEVKTSGAAGLDLCVVDNYYIYPTNTSRAAQATKVHTGLAIEIPEGYHGKIFLRSSTGAKRKLRLANGTGIIDSDYRGEVLLLVENIGYNPESIDEGERLVQLLIEKNTPVAVQAVDELTTTVRGEGGIGSTGGGK